MFGAGLTAVLTERYRGNAPPGVELVTSEAESIPGLRSRLAAYLLSPTLGVIVVVFAVQNTAPISLTPFGWALVEVPPASAVLGALAVGALAAGLPLWIARSSLRSRMRDLEHRLFPDRHDGSGHQ